MGPFGDDRLQRAVLPLELEVQEPGVQEVLDPQEHLDPVERLGQEVLRARGQGALLGRHRHVRGQHQDRHVGLRGDRQLAHHGDPVEVRHHQIEQDQVGMELVVESADLTRIRRRDEVAIAGLLQQTLEKPDVRELVVDDQDPGFVEISHGARSPS